MPPLTRFVLFGCANLTLGFVAACGDGSVSAPGEPLRVISTIPAPDARDVTDHRVLITFNVDIDPSSWTPDTFRVERWFRNLEGSFEYDPERNLAIWSPSRPLAPASEYRVALGRVRTTAGRLIEKEIFWRFRTAPADGWTSPLEIGRGETLSVAADDRGTPAIVFADRRDGAWFARMNSGGIWSAPERIATGRVSRAVLTFDPFGNPTVVYGGHFAIQATRRLAFGWSPPTFIAAGELVDAAQDARGRLLVSARDLQGSVAHAVTANAIRSSPRLQNTRFGVGPGPNDSAQALCHGLTVRDDNGKRRYTFEPARYCLGASEEWIPCDPLEKPNRIAALDFQTAFRNDGSAVMVVVHELLCGFEYCQIASSYTWSAEGVWSARDVIADIPLPQTIQVDLAKSSNGADLVAWAGAGVHASLRRLGTRGWPRHQLEEFVDGTSFGGLATTVTGDNSGFVAWLRSRPGDQMRLLVARHDAVSGWHPAQLIARDLTLGPGNLSLAPDGSGGVVLVWEHNGAVLVSQRAAAPSAKAEHCSLFDDATPSPLETDPRRPRR